jgi:hypothetical protein
MTLKAVSGFYFGKSGSYMKPAQNFQDNSPERRWAAELSYRGLLGGEPNQFVSFAL